MGEMPQILRASRSARDMSRKPCASPSSMAAIVRASAAPSEALPCAETGLGSPKAGADVRQVARGYHQRPPLAHDSLQVADGVVEAAVPFHLIASGHHLEHGAAEDRDRGHLTPDDPLEPDRRQLDGVLAQVVYLLLEGLALSDHPRQPIDDLAVGRQRPERACVALPGQREGAGASLVVGAQDDGELHVVQGPRTSAP